MALSFLDKKLIVDQIVWVRVCLDRTYFAEIENWKYCSKIIFKCVNSTVGPIFNEKVTEKWNLWVREQCTDPHVAEKSNFSAKKKKSEKHMHLGSA